VKFSVIIPFARNEDTIGACLDSVRTAADALERTHPAAGVEILCVNGGSRDGTRALIEATAAADSRIVLLADPPAEIGSGPARNRGLDRACGEYVLFVDADDAVEANALVGLAVAATDIVTFLPPEGLFDLSQSSDVRKLFSPLVGNLLVWNAIYRREVIGDWRFPNLRNHQDLVWTTGMFARVHTVVGGASVWYRYNPNVTGSAVNSHSWARVAAAWRATFGMARAIAPCQRRFSLGTGAVLWLIMARKLMMHLYLHFLCEIPRALCCAKRPQTCSVPCGGASVASPCWLIDARTFSTQPTGVGLYAYRHIRRLRRENPAARFVLTSDVVESSEIKALVSEGVKVYVYGRRVFKSVGVLGYFRYVKRVAREVRPDIFWQPNNVQPVSLRGVPSVIVTVHDVFGLEPFSWKHPLWPLYYRYCFARTLRNVTEIWFNSNDTAERVRVRVPFAAKLATRVVHPLAEVPPRASVAPYRTARPYFLYVGNVETRKGADLLFAAYRAYRKTEAAPFDLIVAGLERNVPVPHEPGFVALGYVDAATKYALMCSAVALVVPSRAEGFGMQFAEALALRVRVIASDLPVFREIDPRGSPNVVYLKGFRDGDDATRVELLRFGLGSLRPGFASA